ncbi:hypothetical protein FRC06_002693 [Ceratobasidium sp. 370]|nr:hypothetical protein FRC06_002693 [Ceratobasidium sp. 370]
MITKSGQFEKPIHDCAHEVVGIGHGDVPPRALATSDAYKRENPLNATSSEEHGKNWITNQMLPTSQRLSWNPTIGKGPHINTTRHPRFTSARRKVNNMASNNLTPISNPAGRQPGESKVVTPAATIPAPPPTNPVAARRVSVSAASKPAGIAKSIKEKPVEASELSGKRIVGWAITHEVGGPVPVLVLLVKGDNDQTATRYELHVAARSVPRPPTQHTHLHPDPAFLAPNLLGPYKRDSIDESSAVESLPDERALGVRIISAALVPRPAHAWENNGAVRLVENIALRLTLEPTTDTSEAARAEPGHARSGSTGGPKTVFVRARTTERDTPSNSKAGAYVPNDGSDEETDHVGDRTSIGEDVILLRA